jgi:tRNA U34 5-methylaminomethyl-2-thiouridine-forming methyltransferase MnmC
MQEMEVVQRSIESFDSKSKIILKQIEICAGNNRNPAIKSIFDTLITLRSIYVGFLKKDLSQEKYFQQLQKHRHEILSVAEFSFGQGRHWHSMRKEILRFLGKNGIGSSISDTK